MALAAIGRGASPNKHLPLTAHTFAFAFLSFSQRAFTAALILALAAERWASVESFLRLAQRRQIRIGFFP
jgi:hypothetical protein